MSTVVNGCDVSWWQGIIDFFKMKTKASFVIIRGGSCNAQTGACYSDYNVATNAMGAEDAKLAKGFYWYYREFGRAHAIKQAQYFWDTINEWSIEEGLFIDVETYDANQLNVEAFLTELRRLSGLDYKKLGIYSRALLWNYITGKTAAWAKKFLCWVARYHAGIDEPWEDYEYMRMVPWTMNDLPLYWQWSADGNGKGAEYGVDSDDIDLNRKFVAELPGPGELPDDALEQLWAEGLAHGWSLTYE